MEAGRDNAQPELEHRLRQLIFNNQGAQSTTPDRHSQISSIPSTKKTDIEPHNRSFVPAEPVAKSSTHVNPRNNFKPPRSVNKRPNQAQRRQMGSELSIALGSQRDSAVQIPVTLDSNHARPASHPVGMDHNAYSSNATTEMRPTGNHSGSTLRNTEPSASIVPQLITRPSDFSHSQTGNRQRPNWPNQQSLPPQNPRYSQPNHQTSRRQYFSQDDVISQAILLDRLCYHVVNNSEIGRDEIAQKEAFRQKIEKICQDTISNFERSTIGTPDFPSSSVELKCFGSLSSGFATKASDMDVGLFSPLSKVQPDEASSSIPRLLEKALLEAGLGARLLSRTRVPIIKLCEKPPESLRHALLLERSKWEHGAEAEASEGHEEEEADSKINENTDDMKANDPVPESASPTEFELPARDDSGVTLRFQLKQNAQSSLPAYYGLAKRVLRRGGGRDATLSNCRELTDLDWVILNRVCQAFVRGLHNTELRDRLESCPSLKFETSRAAGENRSLAGVFVQVEGEQTVLNWDHWLAKQFISAGGGQVQEAITAWRDVQERTDFGGDMFAYNKDLQAALEKIKRLPSIQLRQLEQEPFEAPAQYQRRAQGIVHSLARNGMNMSSPTLKEISLRYITGVNDDKLRGELATAVKESHHQMHLDELGQKHKCLHLAHELEKAADNKVYDENLIDSIRDYIRILRTPLVKVIENQPAPTFIIPVTRALLPLLSTIRLLQDPHKLVVNRPRDRYRDTLEFPAGGVGVQCDINFSAHLALQNTLLLRCYSLTDPRVRPLVLFVKRWAKVRGINSGYRGTLGSYGYVLMVLHYLVNVARPFVCPNLQQLAAPASGMSSPSSNLDPAMCQGYNVQFWRNEHEILHLAGSHQLTHNTETIGQLLRGFFEYFAQTGPLSRGFGKGFDWGRDVLSIRTHGGLIQKQEKGWTGAKTVYECRISTNDVSMNRHGEESLKSGTARSDPAEPIRGHSSVPDGKPGQMKEIRHRYLFAIEDPFELDHNIARTVTHNGIVSIRDEFRRAWRLIRTAGNRGWSENLLQDASEVNDDPQSFLKQLEDIHGPLEQWAQELA